MDFAPLQPGPSVEDEPPRIRLDDYYNALEGYEQQDKTIEVDIVAADALVDVAMEDALREPKPKKKTPMTAGQQRERLEALQAQLARFPQEQSAPISPPVEQREPAVKPVKRRKSSGKDEGVAEDQSQRRQRRKSSQAEKPKRLTYRAMKSLENNITPQTRQVLDFLDRLRKLGRPFEDNLSELVSMAGMVLDGQKKVDGIIEELLRMESEWQAEYTRHRMVMIAFLERHGIIPMGSAS